ncbi:unnamed protein product [Schistosoma margrebowiei]|uniref:Uncharacterized protein n=1 Tax=Schistosoma margrebowiei TaxID=48269 RepID=A0A183LEZ7_9TREM|nr:unnamed protein product [Schistosoma margrebowiei]
MLVGGSQRETLDPGFVFLGTRQQDVPVILRELVLPGGFDLVSSSFTVGDVTTMLVGGSRQETVDPGFMFLGTRHQGVPVILRELVLPGSVVTISSSLQDNHLHPYSSKYIN